MSFCKKCGSELEADRNICPKCGAMQGSEFGIKKIADFCVNAYEKIVIIGSVLLVVVSSLAGFLSGEPVVGVVSLLMGCVVAVISCGAMLQIAYIRKSVENIEKRNS